MAINVGKKLQEEESFRKFFDSLVRDIIEYYLKILKKTIVVETIINQAEITAKKQDISMGKITFEKFLKYLVKSKDLGIHRYLYIDILDDAKKGKVTKLKELQEKSKALVELEKELKAKE